LYIALRHTVSGGSTPATPSNDHAAIQHAQTALHFGGEIDVSGVSIVDLTLPGSGDRRSGDRDIVHVCSM
jgi:hypothetical protein